MVILQIHLKSLVQEMLRDEKLLIWTNNSLFSQKVYTIECSRDSNRSSKVDQYTTNTASDYLHQFFHFCRNLELPTNNSIAFFHALEQQFPVLYQDDRETLQLLMAYALTGHGFPFATYYTYEKEARMHPCVVTVEDYKANNSPESLFEDREKTRKLYEAYNYSIQRLADCATGNSYAKSYAWNNKNFFLPMQAGAKKFESWDFLLKKDATNPFSHLSVSKTALKGLWKLYEQYTKMQYSVYENMECKQAISCLHSIQKIADIIFTLERFWNVLERIKRAENSVNLRYKRKWLDLYRKYLRYLDTVSGTIDSPFDELSLLDTLRLRSFITLAKRDKLTEAEFHSTSLWNKSVPYQALSREEQSALLGYRQHCIYKFVQGMEKILSKEGPLETAPYFLSLFLRHTKKPERPFKTVKYNIQSSHTNFQEDFCSSDERSVQIQKCHQWLYIALWRWWKSVHPEDFDTELSHYLFLRAQRHIINHNHFLPTPKWGFVAEWLEQATYGIQDQLESVLEIESYMLPQYAQVTVDYADFQKFYTKATSEKERQIRKKLEHIITKSMAMEYKEIALVSICGIGVPATEIFWHGKLADWLEAVIRSDDDVANYVEGKFKVAHKNSDSTFPEVPIKLKYRDILGNSNPTPNPNLYPELYYPYLAQVELMIQKICCQRIKEDMLVRVMKMYRKAFLG